MWIKKEDYENLLCTIEDLEDENAELRKKIALAGNSYYQEDAAKYAKSYHKVCRALAERDAEVTRWKNEAEYWCSMAKQFREKIKPDEALRDSEGRFVSDKPKAEKCKIAYQMDCEGIPHEEIAESLGIATNSVRQYIALYEKTMVCIEEKKDKPWWAAYDVMQ